MELDFHFGVCYSYTSETGKGGKGRAVWELPYFPNRTYKITTLNYFAQRTKQKKDDANFMASSFFVSVFNFPERSMKSDRKIQIRKEFLYENGECPIIIVLRFDKKQKIIEKGEENEEIKENC